MVHALGLGEFQVGRSHECDYPPEAMAKLPVCTEPKFDISGGSREIDRRVKATLADAVSVYRVFDDVLERLQPTHIVTQTQCEVCAVSLRDVELALSARYGSRPQVVALEPNSLDGNSKRHPAARAGLRRGGTRFGAGASMDHRMDAIAAGARASRRPPRVAADRMAGAIDGGRQLGSGTDPEVGRRKPVWDCGRALSVDAVGGSGGCRSGRNRLHAMRLRSEEDPRGDALADCPRGMERTARCPGRPRLSGRRESVYESSRSAGGGIAGDPGARSCSRNGFLRRSKDRGWARFSRFTARSRPDL